MHAYIARALIGTDRRITLGVIARNSRQADEILHSILGDTFGLSLRVPRRHLRAVQ